MGKFLFSKSYHGKYFFLILFLSIFQIGSLKAQCGPSSFQAAGTPAAPNSSWQTFPMGSGTYADFNVNAGNIYSFRYNTSSTVSNYWDMTLSTSSAVIAYDNSGSPTRNPWSGGICPTAPGRPSSTDWYANFSGTFRINTNSWNTGSNTCLAHVPGQGSAVLEYKVCPAAPDPGPGINAWNVEAFVTTNISIPNLSARYGYYVDNGLNFATTNYWPNNSNPSAASTWVGCSEIPNDLFSLRARRQGFPCGRYQISDNSHDDEIQIFVNGVSIYSSASPGGAGIVGDPNGYVLGDNDVVEIRSTNLCVTDFADVSFILLPVPAITPGTIGGVTNGLSLCQGSTVGTFTNVLSASGGTIGYNYGGTITYDWELSVDNGANYISLGINSATWVSTDTIPAGGTYIVRRRASDRCGNTDVSNTITIYGRSTPNGSITPANQTICPGTTTALVLNFNPGAEPFNISFTDGATIYSRSGKRSGDTILVSPVVSPTNYSFTSITDSFGCVRNSGFTGAANISLIPSIGITNVAVVDVACNGGNTGSITITAQGGQPPFSYSIDSGATFLPSNVFSGLTIGTYNVVVLDNFGCTQYYGSSVTIDEPTDITQTLAKTDASCANVFDGTITVSAQGGVPPYSYSLNGGPVQPGNVFSGLASGNYQVSVYDTHNCLDTASISIANTYIISVDTVSKTDVSCFGEADGAVTVQVVGGVPPYDYSINGVTFQFSPTFSGLSAGTYIVIGRDSKGCTEFANVNIAQPNVVSIAIDSVVDVACNGASTGSVYITVSGGNAGGYTYQWSNSATTEDNIGVNAGIQNVTVTDTKGCSATNGVAVAEPLPLFLNIAQFNNLSCFGDSTGAVDVTANGGVPPYSFLWSNGATTEDIFGLVAGSYTVTVTDAKGCSQNISQSLTEPSAIVSNIVPTTATCNGAANGSADLTVSGGTSPYFYQWSTFVATQDISGLSGGLYYVVITDNKGCEKRDSVLISEPTALVLSTNVQNISCFNSNDGAVDLTVTGGTPAYTYSWSNGAVTEDISSLAGGTYVVTVTDANLCTASTSATLVNPLAINTSFVVHNPTCFAGSDGSIDLIPSGGVVPYTYSWSNSSITQDLNGIAAGTYILTITDSRNCSKVDSLVIDEPDPLVTSGFIKNVTCNGYSDACVDITAYGGTLPYSFQWSTGQSTEDICNVPGGSYYVSVTDAQNCFVASLYVVQEPTVLNTAIVSTNATCYGSANATVAVIPTGGTKPYEYLWNNFVTDSSQVGIPAGQYVVLVTDSNGCHTYDSIQINQPLEIKITGVVIDVACGGTSTGAINITVSGGTPSYTFAWSNGASTEDLSGLSLGTYTVTVTDANGCTSNKTFTINTAVGLFTNVSISNPLCNGSNNGFVSVDVTGGTLPYTYLWSNGQTGATATGLLAGTYTLTVTDHNSCSATVSGTVVSPAAVTVSTTSTDSKCYNTGSGTVTATATGGVPPYVYELNGVIQISNTFTGLFPGQYIVAARDANGCEGTATFTITSPSIITVDLVAPQPVILEGMTTQLIANASSSPVPVINYYWSGGLDTSVFNFDNCSDPNNCYNPYVAPRVTTVFTVAAMNSDSCIAYDTVTIIVQHEPSAFIPTAFTPNGDNLNDRFEFDILGATTVEVNIFNRWGERMYYNANQPNGITGNNGWDGKKDGKVLPFDTYVYQMKVTYFDGIVKDVSGTVTIMK
ncbi:MAG: gliding motility-associated C-terminal domain-containing protein [Chitinophagales bacterium]